MEEPQPLIVKVIRRYFPEWEAPVDTGHEWLSCQCPFHGDNRPSAGVSYRLNAFNCLACPAKGNAVTIIKQQEGVTYAAAKRLFSDLGGTAVSERKQPRRRRLFSESIERYMG